MKLDQTLIEKCRHIATQTVAEIIQEKTANLSEQAQRTSQYAGASVVVQDKDARRGYQEIKTIVAPAASVVALSSISSQINNSVKKFETMSDLNRTKIQQEFQKLKIQYKSEDIKTAYEDCLVRKNGSRDMDKLQIFNNDFSIRSYVDRPSSGAVEIKNITSSSKPLISPIHPTTITSVPGNTPLSTSSPVVGGTPVSSTRIYFKDYSRIREMNQAFSIYRHEAKKAGIKELSEIRQMSRQNQKTGRLIHSKRHIKRNMVRAFSYALTKNMNQNETIQGFNQLRATAPTARIAAKSGKKLTVSTAKGSYNAVIHVMAVNRAKKVTEGFAGIDPRSKAYKTLMKKTIAKQKELIQTSSRFVQTVNAVKDIPVNVQQGVLNGLIQIADKTGNKTVSEGLNLIKRESHDRKITKRHKNAYKAHIRNNTTGVIKRGMKNGLTQIKSRILRSKFANTSAGKTIGKGAGFVGSHLLKAFKGLGNVAHAIGSFIGTIVSFLGTIFTWFLIVFAVLILVMAILSSVSGMLTSLAGFTTTDTATVANGAYDALDVSEMIGYLEKKNETLNQDIINRMSGYHHKYTSFPNGTVENYKDMISAATVYASNNLADFSAGEIKTYIDTLYDATHQMQVETWTEQCCPTYDKYGNPHYHTHKYIRITVRVLRGEAVINETAVDLTGTGGPLQASGQTASSSEQKAFIKKIGDAAVAQYNEYRILPSLTIAQAIQESGWGKSTLAAKYNNYYGITGSGTAGSVNLPTKEQKKDGTVYQTTRAFAAYYSASECITERLKMFYRMDRYKNLRNEKNAATSCKNVQADGYATDVMYAQRLYTIITQYGLEEYDKTAFASIGASGGGTSTSNGGTSTGVTNPDDVEPKLDEEGNEEGARSEFYKTLMSYHMRSDFKYSDKTNTLSENGKGKGNSLNFAHLVYSQHGITIGKTISTVMDNWSPIEHKDAQTGDIILYQFKDGDPDETNTAVLIYYTKSTLIGFFKKNTVPSVTETGVCSIPYSKLKNSSKILGIYHVTGFTNKSVSGADSSTGFGGWTDYNREMYLAILGEDEMWVEDTGDGVDGYIGYYEGVIGTISRSREAGSAGVSGENYNGGGTGSGGTWDTSKAYLTDSTCNPDVTGSVSGTEVVAYAQQFVGNPYVWGGNSLTHGTDCSGFVHLIYKHFGYNVPRYSQAFANAGRPVAISNLQPGDVIVYPGHVAIYAGNGKLVEALGSKWGITNYRNYDCKKILAVRRLLK